MQMDYEWGCAYGAVDVVRGLVGTGRLHLQANASSKNFSLITF